MADFIFLQGMANRSAAYAMSMHILETTEDWTEEDCGTLPLYNGSKVTRSPTSIVPDCKWNVWRVCVFTTSIHY